MAALVTQTDLESHYKPRLVRDASCDDGSGVAGAALTTAIATASCKAEMILAKGGWSTVQIETLVAGDEALKGAICDIAMYELTKRNPAFIGADGKCSFAVANADALALLENVAAAQLRPASEATAGSNLRYSDRMNAREPMFAPTVTRPVRGGY